MGRPAPHPALALFNPAVQQWFEVSFDAPTTAQARAWPSISNRDSTLLLAPTGSGKTLAAFLVCLDRLMFQPLPPAADRCRILYVSPLKALAVDVERGDADQLAGLDPGVGLDPPAIDANLARSQKLLQMTEAEAGEMRLEPAVEPHARLAVQHLDLFNACHFRSIRRLEPAP